MKHSLGQLRLLLWLKWRLTLRLYQRHMSAALGALLGLVVFVPFALMVGVGCFVGFLLLEPPNAEHLLRAALLGAYLLWLLSPLFGYALTEDYDISKLFLFPLSARFILAGAIVGSVIDLGVLVLLPTMAAVVVGFTKSIWALPVVVCAAGLFLFHALALSQALNLSSAGLLRSRRARDLMVVVIPLLLTAAYVGMQILPHRLVKVNWSRVLESRTWEVINYLPSGLAARAIAGAARGDYVPALGYLVVLGAISLGTLYLAGWLVERLYVGEVVSAPARRRAARTPTVGAAREARPRAGREPKWLSRVADRLSPAVQAVAAKELKYVARDPYFKHGLVMMVYVLAVMVVVFLRPWQDEGGLASVSDVVLWGGTAFVLMTECQWLFNIFGTEGASASVLFMFPSARREIVLGKNAALFVALSAVHVVAAGVLCALVRKLHLVAGLVVWMELAAVILISCGNVVSVFFPARVVVRGWKIQRRSSSRGVTEGLLSLGALGIANCLAAPVLAAVVVPVYWVSALWLVVTIPAAIAYAWVLYRISLRLTEAALLRREIEVAEVLRQEE
jgi:ABC-2 type transport system permease protein